MLGCGTSPALAKEPLASRDMLVPPGTPTLRLLACAEKTVLTLSKTQNNWDDRITLKDPASGRMETGNLYNPYWQPRLVDLTDEEKATATAIVTGGRIAWEAP